MWSRIKQIFWGTLITADEEGNVLAGPDANNPAAGNPHYTISQRLAEARAAGSHTACVLCRVLTWCARRLGSTTTDHCADAMKGMPQSIPTNG